MQNILSAPDRTPLGLPFVKGEMKIVHFFKIVLDVSLSKFAKVQ
jgi:hypothetical protein